MADNARFRVNSKVVHEGFEDELVIVNLDNGNYYTLSGVGADVWALLGEGATTDAIISRIAAAYSGDPDTVREGVTQLVDSLVTENLIMPDATRPPAPSSGLPTRPDDTERRVFEAPVLQKYLDMQALLLLDPIHEVDESGWPLPQVGPH